MEYNYINAEIYKKEMKKHIGKHYDRKMRFTFKEICEEMEKRRSAVKWQKQK